MKLVIDKEIIKIKNRKLKQMSNSNKLPLVRRYDALGSE